MSAFILHEIIDLVDLNVVENSYDDQDMNSYEARQ
jgi:hypothetical protein